jgi:short-chain 2-methylacyl-CoA dehydrogenase
VSVLVDVHNTLVNTAILKYGSIALKEKFLPKLATNTVGKLNNPLAATM